MYCINVCNETVGDICCVHNEKVGIYLSISNTYIRETETYGLKR